MKAAVYFGPEDVRIAEVPKPSPGPGEVLVRMKTSVICATDMKMFRGVHFQVNNDQKVIFGHENTGIIDAIGEQVTGYEIGEAVFIAPNIGCGKCHLCVNGHNNMCQDVDHIGMTLNGGFAEYLLVPKLAVEQGNLIKLKQGTDFAVAALAEPLGCVVRGQKPLDIRPGKSVLIAGGGPIGMLHLKLAKLKGATKIIVSEPNLIRRERAISFGADVVVDPINEDLKKVVNGETNNIGMDVIIVAVSVPQVQAQAIDLAAIRGRICFFAGLPKDRPGPQIDSNAIHYKELVLTGSSGNSTANDIEAMNIINSGKINMAEMITGRYPLDKIHDAFIAAQQPETIKIAVEQ